MRAWAGWQCLLGRGHRILFLLMEHTGLKRSAQSAL
jgi:hypothetical protein